MIHYVYEIKNIIDDKIYVGKHSTENIDDGYMGSGKLLNRAIRKYGIENFRKTIIKHFKTAEEAFEFEKQLVNEEFIKDARTYNLAMGGKGGNIHPVNGNARKIMSFAIKEAWKNVDFRKRVSQCSTKTVERLRKEGKWKAGWKGGIHSEETKKRIGIANSKHQAGKGNSQFGTIWITHQEEKQTQKIKKEEFVTYQKLGWIKGRKVDLQSKIVDSKKERIWHLHTQETKLKMSNFCWMSNQNLNQVKKVRKDEIEIHLKHGWIRGRKNLPL